MIQFVFCHGWGFDIRFWDRLAPYFSQEKYSFVDLGYFNSPLYPESVQGHKTVGIGHSLGLLKLIQGHHHFDALIGLGSFTSFLGGTPVMREVRQRELKALRQNFIKNPTQTVLDFYTRCGVPELGKGDFLFKSIDLERLLSDLDLLKEAHDLLCIPTLVLTSEEDVVVPREVIRDNFSKNPHVRVSVIRDGRHGLGFRKSLEVYEHIMSFLDDPMA